jgi:hypothetical protein
MLKNVHAIAMSMNGYTIEAPMWQFPQGRWGAALR